MKKLDKNIQDRKMEIVPLKKSKMKATVEMEKLGNRSGVTDANIMNRIQEIEERV